MAESKATRARLLAKWREKRRQEGARRDHERRAQAARRKADTESDDDAVKRRVGNGIIWS